MTVTLGNLGQACADLGRYEEGERYLSRALAVREKAFGPDNPSVGEAYRNLAVFEIRRPGTTTRPSGGSTAPPPFSRSRRRRPVHDLDPLDACLPAGDAGSAQTPSPSSTARRGSTAARLAPDERSPLYLLRSRILWDLSRRDKALANMRTALDLQEQSRPQASGTEVERSRAFEASCGAFEQMVTWQAERGDAAEAFSAMERSTPAHSWSQ